MSSLVISPPSSAFRHAAVLVSLIGFLGAPLFAGENKSPSNEQEEWTKNDIFYEFGTDYSHVGGASTTLGNGQTAQVTEDDTHIKGFIARRFFRALLLKTGVEWNGYLFNTPGASFIPDHLYDLNLLASADLHFSRKDMLRLQMRPGLYGDFRSLTYGDDINCPVAMAYTRVVSNYFQWFLALSVDTWRRNQFVPAGGFRWQINDQWKLKMIFPEPHIEYEPRGDLHLFVGADFRGDSFRTGHDFGTLRGNPQLNNALVDFWEIRVGSGFSWNIKPLIELNLHAGYMVFREFDYHDAGVRLYSNPAPYVTANINILFESPEVLLAPKTESGSFEVPGVAVP